MTLIMPLTAVQEHNTKVFYNSYLCILVLTKTGLHLRHCFLVKDHITSNSDLLRLPMPCRETAIMSCGSKCTVLHCCILNLFKINLPHNNNNAHKSYKTGLGIPIFLLMLALRCLKPLVHYLFLNYSHKNQRQCCEAPRRPALLPSNKHQSDGFDQGSLWHFIDPINVPRVFFFYVVRSQPSSPMVKYISGCR